MFDKDNYCFTGNYSADAYITVLMSAIVTGSVFRTIPSEFNKTSFGAVLSQKKDFDKFLSIQFAISDYRKKVLCSQFGITKEDILDCTRTYLLELGNEHIIYPEYHLPNVIPLDWIAIADYAKELDKVKTPKFKIADKARELPFVNPGKEEDYLILYDSMPQNYFNLWSIASQFSGYDTKIFNAGEKDGRTCFGLKGSPLQEDQKRSFFYVIDEITEACKKMYKKSGYNTNDFSLEEFSGLVRSGKIDEPLEIDWVEIIKKSQDIVLSSYQVKDSDSIDLEI